MRALDRLVDLVATLRSEEGCPWDRAQTPETLRGYLLEEAYEVLEAIDAGAPDPVRRELGDLAFNVVMLARIYEERGAFTLADALDAISDKMIARHPHVFGDAATAPDWHGLKAAEEQDANRSILDGLPRALPPLLRAHRVTHRASRVGFDWPDLAGVRDKLDEELAELDEAVASGDADAIADELGDVLFTLVNLGRFLPVDASEALRRATAKFERRFRDVERQCLDSGATVSTTSPETLERYWRRAKESG